MTVSDLLQRLSKGARVWWDRQALQADWELERQIRLTFPEDAADYAASLSSSATRAIKAARSEPDFNPIPPQQLSPAPVPGRLTGSGPAASSGQGDRCGN